MCQVGYLSELYEDARSENIKKITTTSQRVSKVSEGSTQTEDDREEESL